MRQAGNWLELCLNNNVQPDCVYLVLGPRLFQLVKKYRDQQQVHFHIIQLENLSPSGMIHLRHYKDSYEKTCFYYHFAGHRLVG